MQKKEFKLSTLNDIRKVYDDLVNEEIIRNDSGYKLDGTLFRKNTVYLKSATGKTLHEGINTES